jgi:hypothetical protein
LVEIKKKNFIVNQLMLAQGITVIVLSATRTILLATQFS